MIETDASVWRHRVRSSAWLRMARALRRGLRVAALSILGLALVLQVGEWWAHGADWLHAYSVDVVLLQACASLGTALLMAWLAAEAVMHFWSWSAYLSWRDSVRERQAWVEHCGALGALPAPVESRGTGLAERVEWARSLAPADWSAQTAPDAMYFAPSVLPTRW